MGTYSQLKVSLDGELARARRHGRAVSVLLLSIEGLGEARYQRGKDVADAYVLALIEGSTQQLRTADRLFRIEADEFIAAAAGVRSRRRLRAAERVSEMARELRVPSPKGPLGLTVRIGGAAFPHPRVQTSEDLIREAARAFRTMREQHPEALVFSGSRRSPDPRPGVRRCARRPAVPTLVPPRCSRFLLASGTAAAHAVASRAAGGRQTRGNEARHPDPADEAPRAHPRPAAHRARAPRELRYDLRLDLPIAVVAGGTWVVTEVLKGELAPATCRWCDRDADGSDVAQRLRRRESAPRSAGRTGRRRPP